MRPANAQGRSKPVSVWLGAALLLSLALGVLPACSSFAYDLSSLDIEVSSKPAPADAQYVEPFSIKAKNVLYVHGLFGEKIPDVAALLAEETEGATGIANFRVRRFGSVYDWLGTHLSLTLVRLKTVRIEGDAIYDQRPEPSAEDLDAP